MIRQTCGTCPNMVRMNSSHLVHVIQFVSEGNDRHGVTAVSEHFLRRTPYGPSDVMCQCVENGGRSDRLPWMDSISLSIIVPVIHLRGRITVSIGNGSCFYSFVWAFGFCGYCFDCKRSRSVFFLCVCV